MDDTADCMVQALTAGMREGHKIDLISTGKVVEVSPMRQAAIGAEGYFVRVTAEPAGALVEVHAQGGYTRRIAPMVATCRR